MKRKSYWKELSRKEKFEYILEYYKLHITVIVVALICIVSVIHHFATYQPPVLELLMINSPAMMRSNTKDDFDEFLEKYNYEGSVTVNDQITIEENGSYEERQALSVLLAAAELDMFFGNGDAYEGYAQEGVLVDLREYLSEEVLEKYKEDILYAEPEGQEKYPCAILLSENKWLMDNNYYKECYMGIIFNGKNRKVAEDFAKYLLTYEK